MIERSFEISVQDILGLVSDEDKNSGDRVMAGPSRAKAVAVNPKQRSHPLCSASEPCVLISPHTAPQ
jgi:hypothetical protein